jgi:hypothetical protein
MIRQGIAFEAGRLCAQQINRRLTDRGGSMMAGEFVPPGARAKLLVPTPAIARHDLVG